MKRLDITGQIFGRLTAINFKGTENKKTRWSFKCVCGQIKVLNLSDITGGRIKSCGCLRSELLAERGRRRMTTHGMRFHPANDKWRAIKARCDNPKNRFYPIYGGRGIKYDPKWKNFEAFWKDMGPSYRHGLEIDRKDNNGNYCKENCKWSTRKEQQNNRNSCVILKFKGEKLNVTQWAEKLGINRNSIYNRIKYGWSIERIFTTPFKKHSS